MDLKLIHRSCLLTGCRLSGIGSPQNSINKISIQESQRANGFILCRFHTIFIPAGKIHHPDLLCRIFLSVCLISKLMSVIRNCILSGFQTFCKHFLLVLIKIDPVEDLICKHIQQLLCMIIINHLSQLIFCNGKRFCTRNKAFLLNQIAVHIKIINTDTNFSFMLSPVHISINRKGNIPMIVHTDDPYRMLIIQAPHILCIFLCKAENFRQLLIFLIIHPQSTVLHKGKDRILFICLIRHIFRHDPKQDTLLIHHTSTAAEHFLKIPVIIQQVDRISHRPDPEKFFHIIPCRFLFIILTTHLIFCKNGCINTVAFFQTPLHIAHDLRVQVSPLDMSNI